MSNNCYIIAGAGGHASEILSLLNRQGKDKDRRLIFFDDINNADYFMGYDVIKSLETLKKITSGEFEFTLGVGYPYSRRILYEKLSSIGGILIGIISNSIIASTVCSIDKGVDILDFSYIGTNCIICKGSLVNIGAQIHHNCYIGTFCEISPSTILLGNASIGNNCSIGANATILPNIKLCDDVVIGAGAVVTKSINEPGTYTGVPAKKL